MTHATPLDRRPPSWWTVGVLVGVAVALGVLLWPYPPDVLQDANMSPTGRTPGRLIVMAVGWSFVIAGVVVWRTRPGRRMGKLLVATGFVWITATVRAIEVPILWTLGNIIDVAALAFIAYIVLAFPQDTLTSWRHRAIVAMVGASVVTRPIGLVIDGPFDGLNLLSVHEIPGAPLGLELATMGLVVAGLVALAAALASRWAHATPPARRVLAPMTAPGIAFALAWAVYLAYQLYAFLSGAGFNPPTTLFQVLILVFMLSLLALPLTVVLGLARAQARRAHVGELAQTLARQEDEDLEAALQRTLRDESLELVYPVGEGSRWVRGDGTPIELPSWHDQYRCVTYVERHGECLAAIVHDPALREDARLLESVVAVAGMGVANERLAAEVQARLAEVRASRARIVAAGDEARRRIERDLHDGAQQRLLSAAMALRAASAALSRSGGDETAGEASDSVQEATREIEAGLAELRDLARGIHPTVLTEQGLGVALRSLAARWPLSIEVAAVPDGRFPPVIEAAAYFVASEALTNAAKHAQASRVRVSAVLDAEELVLEVSDDGPGGASLTAGGGLVGVADRVAALDGTFDLTSPAAGGTTVAVRIPLPVDPSDRPQDRSRRATPQDDRLQIRASPDGGLAGAP